MSGRVRIGFNLLYLRPGRVGGSEVYSRELLAALSRRSGLEIVVFCWPDAAESLAIPGVVVDQAATGTFTEVGRMVAENLGLASRVRRHGIDVLLSPANFCAPLLPAAVPQVATLHDLQHVHLPQCLGWKVRLKRALLFRLTVWRCRELIAISEFTRADVIGQLGVNPAKVTTILEGVDPWAAPSEEDQRRVRQTWTLPREYFYYPAMLAPHKNHEILLHALAEARRRSGRDLQLVLTGDRGDGYDRFVAVAERTGVASAVRHLGFVPRGDVLPILAGAKGLVFPSRFEGFGLPILEAHQCGIPVVASASASIPEVAGDAAILLSPDEPGSWADAMMQVLRPDVAEGLVARGRRNVERFSWDRCAEQTEAVLRRACRKA